MKNKYCTECNQWKPSDQFVLSSTEGASCIPCIKTAKAEAEIDRRHADAASQCDEDVSDEPMSLEQRLHLQRTERNHRRMLAERLYRDLLNDELRVRLATGVHVELALPWQTMACCAVEGADALLMALDGQQVQQQIPPYESGLPGVAWHVEGCDCDACKAMRGH